MVNGRAAQAQPSVLAHLRDNWASQNSWTLLDTGFGHGLKFLEIWQYWRSHANRPAMLHYVGALSASDASTLVAALDGLAAEDTVTAKLSKTLAALCYGMESGFHRILLEGGKLSLTLCVGDGPYALEQQDMRADTLVVCAAAPNWDKWALKALARCCKRGTQVFFNGTESPAPDLLVDAGFKVNAEVQGEVSQTLYDPRWQLRSSRRAVPETAATIGRCAVVGAGIAGASVAHALAVRGWQVDVYDTQPTPAGGASGLPVGLVAPHHSADDNPRSRMSRAGTRLMLQHATEQLQVGQDWQRSGVLELSVAPTGLADAEAEVLSHYKSDHEPTGWAQRAQLAGTPGLWHPHAGWIKPARLVQAWLDHSGINFHGTAEVHALKRAQHKWWLHNVAGTELGSADNVVFANAHACVELLLRLACSMPPESAWVPDMLEKLQRLQTLHGTLSMGSSLGSDLQSSQRFPPFPVNGHGSFVSGVPGLQGTEWYAGSTFGSTPTGEKVWAQEHSVNLHKLRALLPEVAATLAPQFTSHKVRAWQGTRCATHDRLPLVGPLEDGVSPSLWLCVGMGALGLSFSALCAELLAAWLGHEPLPLERKMAQSLSTSRALHKKRQKA